MLPDDSRVQRRKRGASQAVRRGPEQLAIRIWYANASLTPSRILVLEGKESSWQLRPVKCGLQSRL
ncbi:16658_t:CDS:1, partial [Acaulospora colombiana]